MCEPTEENVKCAHDHSDYPAALIQKLRMYFHGLPRIDQRHFVAPGVRCSLDQDRLVQGGDLTNVKVHGGFRLETPLILEERLNTALFTKTHLPAPKEADCNAVCNVFLLFAIDRSRNWFNQINHKQPSRKFTQNAVDRV